MVGMTMSRQIQMRRSYRMKLVSYYNELCEIYADVTLKQRHCIADQNGNINGAETHLDPACVPEAGDVGESALQTNNCEATGEPLHDILIDEEDGKSASMGFSDDLPQPAPCNTFTVPAHTRTYCNHQMDYLSHARTGEMGSQVDSSFQKQAWTGMIGFNYEVDILKIIKNPKKAV